MDDVEFVKKAARTIEDIIKNDKGDCDTLYAYEKIYVFAEKYEGLDEYTVARYDDQKVVVGFYGTKEEFEKEKIKGLIKIGEMEFEGKILAFYKNFINLSILEVKDKYTFVLKAKTLIDEMIKGGIHGEIIGDEFLISMHECGDYAKYSAKYCGPIDDFCGKELVVFCGKGAKADKNYEYIGMFKTHDKRLALMYSNF